MAHAKKRKVSLLCMSCEKSREKEREIMGYGALGTKRRKFAFCLFSAGHDFENQFIILLDPSGLTHFCATTNTCCNFRVL